MNVYRFRDPIDHAYAQAGFRGTWSEGTGICPECTSSKSARISPLVIEWEPGSAAVGHLTWPRASDIALSKEAADFFRRQFPEVSFGPVEMVQDPKRKRSSRGKPRVWLPWEGPPLTELIVAGWIEADRKRSTLSVAATCSLCGFQQHTISGIEENSSRWDKERKELRPVQEPRTRGAGLVFNQESLRGQHLFRARECPAWILCTEEAKESIEMEGLTNVSFLEVGELATAHL